MPLTERERRFLGHYSDETRHFESGHVSCLRQLRERGIDHHDLLPLLKLEDEERIAESRKKPMSLEFVSIPQIPDTPTDCPWPDARSVRERVVECMRLGEVNAHLSRDFQYARRYGFFNRAPGPDEESVIYSGEEPRAPKGWVFRGRFGGIRRGHVEEGLRDIPVSIWDPTYQSSLADQCDYLALVETTPEPMRVRGLTRLDVLWFTADEAVYKTIFPTPPAP